MADAYCGGVATPCVAAVAQVDDCTNVPIEGLTAYVLDGFRNVSWEPQIEEAEQATFKDSCGNIVCRNDENCDQLLGFTVEFEKCAMPYELFNLLTGQPIVSDGGEVVGWYHSDAVKCQPRVALMFWEKTLGCNNTIEWQKTIFPNVRFSFPTPQAENDLVRFHQLTARADPGYLAGYGDGPFLDDDVLGWAALPATRQGAIGQYVSNDAPPVAQCGLVAVDLTP